ncbi:hypothetical protein EON65_14755 [archaeon]|nr:MAG: hypothetical protein EON65_14755 [archaeon]
MAESPFLFYKELSASGHVVAAVFFRSFNSYRQAFEEHLCSLSTDVISIYKVSSQSEEKLKLVFHERLFGTPRDVRVYTRGGDENDILLLALDIGKLVTFEFIVEEARIALHTMCNIEENAIGLGSELKCITNGKQTFLGRGEAALIKVDQVNQLVCMLSYGEFLLFCSLNNDMDYAQEKELLPMSKRFLVHLQTQLLLLGPILDIAFIAGYDHPVIAVLQQERFVPTGHLAKVNSTCAVSVLAVDVVQKKLTLLYKHTQFPHDCCSLVDLDNTGRHGMFMVISNNALLIANGEHVMGLPTNAFASVTVNKDKIALLPHENLKIHRNLGERCTSNGLELAGSCWVQKRRDSQATNLTLFGMLSSRDVLQIDIFWASNDDFGSLYIAGESVYTNVEVARPCFATMSPMSDVLFVASPEGKATLFRLDNTVSDELEFDDQAVFLDEGVAQEIIDGNYLFLSPPSSQQDDDPLALVERNKMLEELIKADLDIYTEVRQDSKVRVVVQRFEFKEADCLSSIGSISQAVFMKNDDLQLPLLHRITYHSHLVEDAQNGWVARDEEANVNSEAPMISHASFIVEREAKDSLYVCHGKTFTRVYRGVPCHKVASRHFPGVVKCQTIAGLAVPYGLLFLAYESRSRVLYYINAAEQGMHEMIMQESSPDHKVFITSSSTVYAGVLHRAQEAEIVVQVTNLAVRVVKLQHDVSAHDCASLSSLQHEAMQDMLLAESVELGGLGGDIKENIIVADSIHGYIVVLTSYHNLHILKFNEDDEFLEVKYNITYSADTRMNAHNNFTDNPGELLELLSSRILYASLFAAPLQSWAAPAAPPKKPRLSKLQKEEMEMYGCLLGDSDDANEMQTDTSENGMGNSKFSIDNPVANVPYMVLTDREGYLSIVNLSTFELVMHSREFSGDKKVVAVVPVTLDEESGEESKQAEASNDHMIEAKLHALHVDQGQLSYCLVILYHTGELRVYTACTQHSTVVCFQRHLSQLVHNHRAIHSKNVKAFHNQEASESGSYLDSEDYANRIPTTMLYVPYVNTDILDAVFLSGSDPYVLTLHRGMPVLHTVDMPETPYINYGHHQLFPIHSPSSLDRNQGVFNAEKITYLSTLWFEYDDIELLKNPGLAKIKQARPTTLEIYRMLPDVSYDISVTNSQGLTLAYRHIQTRDPIVKVLEFNRMLTDSKTEQALLNKKTYLMVSCPQKLENFPSDLAAGLEDDPEIVQLERYFPDVTSFSDSALKASGLPLPPKVTKEYVLNLIQQGVVVDQHIFPSTDRLLDVIVFYAPIEHMGAVINPATRHSKQQTVLQVTNVEKRIMVLASTVERDIRGEDSQCFGKILLFALDYALFDEEEEGSVGEEEKKGDDGGEMKINVKLFSEGGESGTELESSNGAVKKEESISEVVQMKVVDDDAPDGVEKVSNPPTGQNGAARENVPTNGDSMEVDPAVSAEETKSTKNGNGKAKPKAQTVDFFENIQPKLRLVWTGPGPASVLAQMPFNTGVTNTANNNTIQAYISAFTPTNSPIVYGSYIVATVQSTVFVYKFKGETLEMEQVAFYFAQVR